MSRFPELALALTLLAAPAAAQGVGRVATPDEIAAWNIDARPDGQGLPKGRGTAKQGEAIFLERCAACHGEFGEGAGRWPELAGGQGSLTGDRPLKTIGSYFPYAVTVFDYISRAMPFGAPRTLTADETYSLVAFLLNLNDIVTDENFVIDQTTLPQVKMPNAAGFYPDDRESAEKSFWNPQPCMADCKPEAHITGRATVLDVTPDTKTAPKME